MQTTLQAEVVHGSIPAFRIMFTVTFRWIHTENNVCKKKINVLVVTYLVRSEPVFPAQGLHQRYWSLIGQLTLQYHVS